MFAKTPSEQKPFLRASNRFSEIEGIVFLSMLVRKYHITITEDPKFAGETFEQRRARVFKVYSVITLTPEKIPVTLTRRR
jgi:hypothetical protein